MKNNFQDIINELNPAHPKSITSTNYTCPMWNNHMEGFSEISLLGVATGAVRAESVDLGNLILCLKIASSPPLKAAVDEHNKKYGKWGYSYEPLGKDAITSVFSPKKILESYRNFKLAGLELEIHHNGIPYIIIMDLESMIFDVETDGSIEKRRYKLFTDYLKNKFRKNGFKLNPRSVLGKSGGFYPTSSTREWLNDTRKIVEMSRALNKPEYRSIWSSEMGLVLHDD